MDPKFTGPEVTIKNRVISSDIHCADAVLVEVRGGTEALAFEDMRDGRAVTLNGESLFRVNDEKFCPTCGGIVYRAYGERNVSMEEAMALDERMNAPYTGLRDAVERMRPLLGILKSGHYMVADYALFPFSGGTYFWHDLHIPEVFYTWNCRWGVESCVVRICPSYMIPSQRAATCNPERIDHYAQLPDTQDYPRAIGLYLSGNMVLLLDGHHKAAAAASRGSMVRCLVIIPVLFGRSAEHNLGSGNLLHCEAGLMDETGKILGWAHPVLDRNLKDNSCEPETNPEDFSDWGSVPEKYVPDCGVYNHIPCQEMMHWVHFREKDAYEIARNVFRSEYRTPKNKRQVLDLLYWHQVQFNVLSGGKLTPWQMPLFERKQFSELLRAARSFGLDRDPKTANAVYGVFSFLPGQRRIVDIPEVLQYKLKNEAIHTVLIPNSAREVDDKVFDIFPDLENIVLEKGNPCLHREHFRAIALKAREKRKGELHLKQYPFANLAEMLKKKQAEQ